MAQTGATSDIDHLRKAPVLYHGGCLLFSIFTPRKTNIGQSQGAQRCLTSRMTGHQNEETLGNSNIFLDKVYRVGD